MISRHRAWVRDDNHLRVSDDNQLVRVRRRLEYYPIFIDQGGRFAALRVLTIQGKPRAKLSPQGCDILLSILDGPQYHTHSPAALPQGGEAVP